MDLKSGVVSVWMFFFPLVVSHLSSGSSPWNLKGEVGGLPRGLAKWITLPSSLNMLTSSMA